MIQKLIYSFFVIAFGSMSGKLLAQSVHAELHFLQDSAYVGEVVQMDFVISHPQDMMVAFPDSGPVFKPFEIVRLEPKLTHTQNGISNDTLRIHLRTLFLYPFQFLKLPFAYYPEGDSIYSSVQSDTLIIKKQVISLAPPPPFKSRESIIPVSTPPDYRRLGIMGLIGLLVLAFLIFSLRKPVREYFSRRKVKREWATCNKNLRQLSKFLDKPATYLDLLNQYWKSYLDPRHSLSLRSYTTSELMHHLSQLTEINSEQQQNLLQVAKTGDQAIYAGENISPDQLQQLKKSVQGILSQVFKNRLNAISRKT